MMDMTPSFMPREGLLAILDDIRRRVELGDSFEGFVQYLLPDEGDPPDGFRVSASYRVGNLQGQGGMRIVQGHQSPGTAI